MTARTCYTQLQNMTRDLNRTSLPRLPPAPGFEGEADFMRQVRFWKEWIEWEKADNLVFKDEDVKIYRKRVLFTYKQALMALQFWPEMWYDAAEFCFENGMEKEGVDFLKQGITANPESCLLAFKLADRIELTTTNDDGNDPGAKSRMAKVRDPYDKVLNALYDLAAKTKARESLEIAKIEESNSHRTNPVVSSHEPDEEIEEDPVETESKRAAVQAQIDAIKHDAATQTALLQKTISYAWVALIRAARRIQGKGMAGEKSGGFRVVFGDARKKGKITSDVYVENALIEYHCYKDPVGTKIFERGMKLFPEDENFALEYLKHLIAINDITSTYRNEAGEIKQY
jgi:cleavage stimulation factor subunit 3